MDKELIQRLAEESGLSFWKPHQAIEAQAAANHNASNLALASRFAALVAEECAKALEEHHIVELHDKFGDKPVTYHRPPDPMAASFLRRLFGHRERYEPPAAPDWKVEILRALRILQKYPVSKVQTTGQRADGSRVAYSFDPQWLRDTSDQDVLEAIEIMEAKR